jgi:tRNA pseudouridine55 synthase
LETKEAYLEGQVLLIDKPLGWSSFQAVNAVRWSIRRKFDLKKIKVGHAGTLDPLATGLLLICTGKSTKTISELQGQIKEYEGVLILGATTPSYDLETAIDQVYPVDHITEHLIEEARKSFIGLIEQRPPVFSALKKDGKRLYEFAREGEFVDIPSRQVEIENFEITSINLPEIKFRVVCSKGTYIRSLVHDFGKALRSGSHLTKLRRTKIGDFNVDNAQGPQLFEQDALK